MFITCTLPNTTSSSSSSTYVPTYTLPTDLTATYGEHLSDIKLPENFSWVDAFQSVGNIGTNKFAIKFTPNVSGVYGYIVDEVTVDVKKADNTFTEDLSLANWTYGDKQNTPKATAKEGAVKFLYSNEKDGIYTETVPTDAGTYYVKAVSEENDNYEKTESKPLAFTIQAKSAEKLTIPEINKNTDLSNLEIKDGNTVLKDNIDYDIKSETNYDEVTVTITFKGNYQGEIKKTYTKYALSDFTFKRIKPSTTTVKGTGLKGATVTILNSKNKQIGNKAKVNTKGKYTLTIPKQKKNTTLTIKMSKKSTASVSKVITVK